MANELTGDFDVVVQFGVQGVNRVLAAMHRLERFPHSLTLRVDDNHLPGATIERPTVVALVDSGGDAVANHQRIGQPLPPVGAEATSASYSRLDGIVNLHAGGVGDFKPTPSRFQGRAQLQLFPPTLEIADSSGTKVAIRIRLLTRYFPDPGTPPAAEFLRAELKLTAPVNRVASQVGNIIEIDIKADTVGIDFTPQWSSNPLAPADLIGIHQLIRNALKTSFLPSNSTLPSNISNIQFKTLAGGAGAVAMLLDMNGSAGNPATVQNVFLSGADSFAFALGADFVKAKFQPTLDKLLAQPIDPVKFDIDAWLHTWHITYTVVLNGATVDLESNWIVLTLKGHAHTGRSWLPDFDFTVRQKLGLQPNGPTADLTLGDISLDTSSTVANLFRGPALDAMRKVRDGALAESGANGTVSSMLDANVLLGPFLESLLVPASKKLHPKKGFDLAYTSAEIRPSGVVLHGSLAVTSWPVPHVEFEQVPTNPRGPHGVPGAAGLFNETDYSALRSWIPGGTIQRYEWKHSGQTSPGVSDANKFIFSDLTLSVSVGSLSESSGSAGGAETGAGPNVVTEVGPVATAPLNYSTVCLTVHGTRLSAAGIVGAQPLSATICGIRHFPIGGEYDFGEDGDLATVALARKGPNGLVEVTGHTAARPDRTGSSAPNLIVHFADGSNSSLHEMLPEALKESGRDDAPTAILVVAAAGGLSKTRYTDAITYAEDAGEGWSRRFGVTGARRPITLVVAPNGKVVWKHEGEIDRGALTEALRKSLVARTPVRPLFAPAAKTGQAAPNFLFEYAPGRESTLAKLVGRAAVLHFFRGSAKPSDEELRELRQTVAGMNGENPVVLAIGGEESRSATKGTRETVTGITLVPDPGRKIARAYGVTAWPTTVFIDSLGQIQATSLGRGPTGKGI